VEYSKYTIKCAVVDESVSTCVMSLVCWKYLGSLTLSKSLNMLTTFDIHSFSPHSILPTFLVQLGGKTVEVEVEVVDVPLDYNLLLGHNWNYAMIVVVSSVFHTHFFPHEGKITTIEQLSFACSSPNASIGPSIPMIDNSQATTENIGVRMYSSLMGTFKFMSPSHHVYSMSSRPVLTGSSIPFRTSYFGDTSTLPSLTASCEGHPHTRITSPTSFSHVGYGSTTSSSHVEDQEPTATSHAGGTSLVIASHTAHASPTSISHVGNPSPNSISHVEDLILSFAIHVGSMSLATASHDGGIHMIEKPRRVRHNPKFLCILCKGDHLTFLCPDTIEVHEVFFFPEGPLGFELSLASQPSLVDTIVMPMQYLADTHLPLGDDASLDLDISHHIQPMVEEVVMPMQSSANPTLLLESDKPKEVTLSMQYSVNPTLLLEGNASYDHVLSISISLPSSLGSIPLSSSMLPPSPRVVSFDWYDLVEPQLPSSTPFQISDILQYIVDKVTFASILSSLTWKSLGFPKLVSTLRKLLAFHRSPAWEPWPPPLYDS
jgi:hypothetical protein